MCISAVVAGAMQHHQQGSQSKAASGMLCVPVTGVHDLADMPDTGQARRQSCWIAGGSALYLRSDM